VLLLTLEKSDIMKYCFQIGLILLICISDLQAQKDVNISKKDFMTDKQGFKEAWRHLLNGDDYFKAKGVFYGYAFEEYLKASTYNRLSPELNYKIGLAALFSDNKEKAAEYLLRAFTLKNEVSDDILLFAGRALQYTGQYKEAIEKLNGYLNAPHKKSDKYVPEAKKYIEECNSALGLVKDTINRIEIKNIGSNINSNADDYSELISVDGKTMLFASRRELSKKSTYYEDTKFDENILMSGLNGNSWELAYSAGKKLNTKYCEAPLYLNNTGDVLYVYTGYERGGDIMASEKKNREWKAPKPVKFKINTAGSETSFTFAPSGDQIWFVSDKRKLNIGGKDIYSSRRIDQRKWTKPEKAGMSINSAYDEESIRFSRDGDTLWFASMGHNTIGGFDIFYSVKNQNGEWNQAVNCGNSVNTPWDELFYFPSPVDDSSFYFVSNRSGGLGGLDIYHGRILPPEPVIVPVLPPKPDTVIIRDTIIIVKEIIQPPVVVPEPPKEEVIYVIGKIKDSETSEPILAKIDLIDLSSDMVIATTASSDVDGSYRMKLPAKKSYMIDIRGSGYLSDMKRINIPETYKEEVYNLDVSLIKVKVGKKVVLNNILFETGKSILTTASFVELDRLLNILQDEPLMRIEISGHTDITGSLALNNKLSEDRARAVVEYLVQKGIDRSRLEFKGFGPSQPIADNATSAGRAKNRRVEFKILEF
jgi:outer membrane protein OmpA-like peptidoglycan-associated protein